MWPISVCLTACLWVLHSFAGLLFFIRFPSFSLDSQAFFFVGRLVDFHEFGKNHLRSSTKRSSQMCCKLWILTFGQSLVPYFQNGTKHWNQDHYTPRRCSETATVATQVKTWKIAHLMDRTLIKTTAIATILQSDFGKARVFYQDFSAIFVGFPMVQRRLLHRSQDEAVKTLLGNMDRAATGQARLRIARGPRVWSIHCHTHTHTYIYTEYNIYYIYSIYIYIQYIYIYTHCIYKLYKWLMTGKWWADGTYWDLTDFFLSSARNHWQSSWIMSVVPFWPLKDDGHLVA